VVRSPELVRNIYACLIAQATNLGLVGMAEASGIPYTWTASAESIIEKVKRGRVVLKQASGQ
jgi:hypothetical protein